MNDTLINEIDSKAISYMKKEIIICKDLIKSFEKKIKLEETTFDKATEFSSMINGLSDDIKDFEQKILTITYKYF